MGTILEKEIDIVTEAQKREAYNAKIGENYKRLMEGNVSELKNEAVSQSAQRKYDSLDAYKPLHARKEITFEDVQIPADFMAQNTAPVKNAAPAQTIGRDSVLQSKEYVEASNRMAAQSGAAFAPQTQDQSLFVPTSATLQYGSAQTAAKPAAQAAAQSVAAEQSAYYAQMLKKVIAVFAVAVVALLLVITVNSAVLRGMDLQIENLQVTLDALRAEVEALQQAVESETAWENILDYILGLGMILP